MYVSLGSLNTSDEYSLISELGYANFYLLVVFLDFRFCDEEGI